MSNDAMACASHRPRRATLNPPYPPRLSTMRTWGIFSAPGQEEHPCLDHCGPRGSLLVNKPPLSFDDLVDRLVDRGLHVPDRGRALRYLRHIGYYRLSPYTIPSLLGGPYHLSHDGMSFDDILDLYVFDRKLRLLVMDALERVEVAVRAALPDHTAKTYDDSH